MLMGEKVYLRAIQEEDLPQLLAWRNLPHFRQYFREYRELNMQMQKQWFQTAVTNDKNTIMFSICHKETHSLLGCCGLCSINWVHRWAELSLYIGDKECYIDEDGYAFDSCQILFDYAFGELNLNKIWAEIYELDHPKKKLYTALGFHRDGVLREHYFYRGKYWDSLLFSFLKNESYTKDPDDGGGIK